MNVVFSIRKDQKNSNRLAVIYWYVSYKGQRSKKYSTGVRVDARFWKRNHATGKNAKPINDALSDIRADLTDVFNQMKDSITHIQEVARVHNEGLDRPTVIELYDSLVARKKSENWTEGTIKSYTSFRDVWLVPFCQKIGNPFYADLFRPKHLEQLCTFMRQSCKEEFVRKSTSKVKAALNLGFSLGKIPQNYLAGYVLFHRPNQKKEYIYLEIEELDKLEKLTFSSKEKILERDRDLFLLQCYTTLAFNEIKNLDFKSNIEIDENEEWDWISITRGKTNALQQIPLLPQPISILEKYNFKLEVPPNHRYNRNLRICAYRAGIDKYLHSHLGRTTAGAFFLNSGITIHTVSRLMGHKSIAMTEKHYAKIIDRWRLQDEFTSVFRKQK
ncbi:site-specific integrase [Bernardetia sp.]|uniref:site-specific integrase n=1 Tax=Bernardetia sp. TaxID=1937974 RepID=UPI0025BA0717|nr:site-specific integrase [Bernardetia sp.]